MSMGAFEGLVQIGSTFDVLTNKVKNFEVEVVSAGQRITKLAEGVSLLPGTPGLAPGEIFSPEVLKRSQQYDPKAGGTALAAILQDLIDRITKVMGPDNYIAKLLAVEIPYLKQGARSAQEGQAFVQATLIPFLAGLRAELADPKTPPEMRKLIEELIQISQSGFNFTHKWLDDIGKKADQIPQHVDAGMTKIGGSMAGLQAVTASTHEIAKDTHAMMATTSKAVGQLPNKADLATALAEERRKAEQDKKDVMNAIASGAAFEKSDLASLANTIERHLLMGGGP